MDYMTTPTLPAHNLLPSWKRIVWLILFFSLCSLVPGSLWAATYYVDASNPNAGDGSPGNPWQKVSSVNGYSSGDTILFKRGEVWHESLVVSSSGTVDAPITFGAYGSGDPPLFDGATRVTSWTSTGGGIYTAPWPGSDPGLLIYNGVAKPSITTLQFASVPAALKKNAVLLQKDVHYTNLWVTSTNGNTVSGITFFPTIYETENVYVRQLNASGKEETWSATLGHPTGITSPAGLTEPGHWYWDTDTLYLYSDIDPNTINVEIGQLATGISAGGRNYLHIQDIAVRGYQDAGVLLSGTQGVVVQNMQVSNIGAASPYKTGILLINATGNTVKNNRVESALRVGIGIYADSANSHGNTVSGNTVVNTGSTGISLNTDLPSNAALVQDNIIDSNTVIGADKLAYDSAGIYLLNIGDGNVLKNNVVADGGSKYLRSAGIMADGGSSPLEMSYNTLSGNSLAGIAVTGSGHTIDHNIVRNNGLSSWESAQILFFTVTGNASDCFVQSNTVEARGTQKLFLVLNGASTSGDLPHDIDYNTYRSEAPDGFCWNDDWACDQWENFKSWKSETGQDAHSGFSLITAPLPPTGFSITSMYILLL